MPLTNRSSSVKNIGPIITSHSAPLRTGVEATNTPHQRKIYSMNIANQKIKKVDNFQRNIAARLLDNRKESVKHVYKPMCMFMTPTQ